MGSELQHVQHKSAFENLEEEPERSVIAVFTRFLKDSSPVKLSLAAGIYKTEEGKSLVLNVVRRAEERLITECRLKDYLPQTGFQDFKKAATKLILGSDSQAILERRVVTVQCLSCTGSLRLAGEFLAKNHNVKIVYFPVPTWENHYEVFSDAGLIIKGYRYYDTRTRALDYQGMLQDIEAAQSGSVILFHASAHNPTGVDPTGEQWEGIRHLIRAKGHLPLFDASYLGFASGSVDEDAKAIRSFAVDGGECLIAQSFSKNFGLYGERVGALSIVCQREGLITSIESQLKRHISALYLTPPIHGALIVSTILNDSCLYSEWKLEVKAMADRIKDMRHQLYGELEARGTPGDWTHILKQTGMFSFTGLSEQQVEFLAKEYHIYMVPDGRMSIAGLNPSIVPQVADAIHVAVTQI